MHPRKCLSQAWDPEMDWGCLCSLGSPCTETNLGRGNALGLGRRGCGTVVPTTPHGSWVRGKS